MNTDELKPIPDGFRDVISDETARRLVEMVFGIGPVADFVTAIKAMPDHELGGLLIDHVWAYLPGGSPQAKLVDEVIDRLCRGGEWEECPDCKGVGTGCATCKTHGAVWKATEMGL